MRRKNMLLNSNNTQNTEKTALICSFNKGTGTIDIIGKPEFELGFIQL